MRVCPDVGAEFDTTGTLAAENLDVKASFIFRVARVLAGEMLDGTLIVEGDAVGHSTTLFEVTFECVILVLGEMATTIERVGECLGVHLLEPALRDASVRTSLDQ